MKRRQGYTLVDMLLAVMLLGTFLLLSARLLYANSHLIEATFTAESDTARFDRAIMQLREDVHHSTALEMPQPSLLRIHLADKSIVEWTAQAGTLARGSNGSSRFWNIDHTLQLNLDGAIVLLSVSPTDQIALAAMPAGATK